MCFHSSSNGRPPFTPLLLLSIPSRQHQFAVDEKFPIVNGRYRVVPSSRHEIANNLHYLVSFVMSSSTQNISYIRYNNAEYIRRNNNIPGLFTAPRRNPDPSTLHVKIIIVGSFQPYMHALSAHCDLYKGIFLRTSVLARARTVYIPLLGHVDTERMLVDARPMVVDCYARCSIHGFGLVRRSQSIWMRRFGFRSTFFCCLNMIGMPSTIIHLAVATVMLSCNQTFQLHT